MPVLPEVASTIRCPGQAGRARGSSRDEAADRSSIEPHGLAHSSGEDAVDLDQ
jgi:hypothetical protein